MGKNRQKYLERERARKLEERRKKHKKKKMLSWLSIVAILFILVGLTWGGIYFGNTFLSDRLYNKAAANVVTAVTKDEKAKITLPEEPEMIDPFEVVEDEEIEEEDNGFIIKEYTLRYTGDWKQQVNVDMSALTSQYPEVKGWLFFENDEINYPIMYSGDDDKYIRTTFDGKSAKAGSIFMEGTNSADFSDSHTILYGHNMRNRSMFGALKDYMTQPNYYDYHKYFQIFMVGDDGQIVKNRYQVFSYFTTPYYSNAYTVVRNCSPEMTDLIQYCQSNSLRGTGVQVASSDKVVTLSTCSTGDDRFVVNGVLVDSCIQN